MSVVKSAGKSLLQAPRRVLVGLVRAYRLLLSPSIGQDCRFAPTCSVYAIEALGRHGALVGTGLAAWRILRCNPLCAGGCDPVPDNGPWERARAFLFPHRAPGLFTGLPHRESGVDPAPAGSAAAATGDPTFSKTPS